MKRRGFLKALAGLAGALALPFLALLPKGEKHVVRVYREEQPYSITTTINGETVTINEGVIFMEWTAGGNSCTVDVQFDPA